MRPSRCQGYVEMVVPAILSELEIRTAQGLGSEGRSGGARDIEGRF